MWRVCESLSLVLFQWYESLNPIPEVLKTQLASDNDLLGRGVSLDGNDYIIVYAKRDNGKLMELVLYGTDLLEPRQ